VFNSRFLSGDAYIYDDAEYGMVCIWCPFATEGNTFAAGYDFDLMIEHIAKHRAVGDYIPYTIDNMLLRQKIKREKDKDE
jgi:hypothetical protein